MPLRLAALLLASLPAHAEHANLRDYGIRIGVLPPGKWNAITDVPGVLVGQKTLIEGDEVRTGVTAIRPTRATSSRTRFRPRCTSATASAS